MNHFITGITCLQHFNGGSRQMLHLYFLSMRVWPYFRQFQEYSWLPNLKEYYIFVLDTNIFLSRFFVLEFFNHVPTSPSPESECFDKQQVPVLDGKIDASKTSDGGDGHWTVCPCAHAHLALTGIFRHVYFSIKNHPSLMLCLYWQNHHLRMGS